MFGNGGWWEGLAEGKVFNPFEKKITLLKTNGDWGGRGGGRRRKTNENKRILLTLTRFTSNISTIQWFFKFQHVEGEGVWCGGRRGPHVGKK